MRTTMKRHTLALLAGGLVVGALALGIAGTALAGPAFGASSPGGRTGNSGYGGMMGSYGPGSMMSGYANGGMMGNGGPGDMMGNGGPGGMMGGWNSGTPRGKPLTLDQAQQSVQGYIAQFGNPNLAIDEVMEFQRNFYAIVKDKSTGHGAFEVLVNKVTGAVFPEYGPNMMWNTTYGMMGHMMGYQQPSGPMTVSSAQATRIARQWLDQNQPGATMEAAEQFPGYYTVHILKNGKVTGMLSVNGDSGQVWYHTWHGAFIRMKDLHV